MPRRSSGEKRRSERGKRRDGLDGKRRGRDMGMRTEVIGGGETRIWIVRTGSSVRHLRSITGTGIGIEIGIGGIVMAEIGKEIGGRRGILRIETM